MALGRATADENERVRLQAVAALRKLGAEALVMELKSLELALKDPNPRVRALAAAAIAQVGPHAKETIPRLASLLADPVPGVRLHAARALGKVWTLASSGAARGSIASTQSATPSVPERPIDPAREASLSAELRPLVRALVGALDDEYRRARREVVKTLSRVARARIVVAWLLEAWPGLNSLQRTGVANALGHAQGPAALKHLTATLEDPAGEVALAAAKALGRIGVLPPSSLDALVRALKHPQVEVRRGAAQALLQLAQPRFIPELVAALSDEDGQVRGGSALVLARFKGAATPALLKTLAGPNADARLAAALALRRQGPIPGAPNPVPELTRALSDSDPRVRVMAARALARQGPLAKSALATLHAIPAGAAPALRAHALRAIAEISPTGSETPSALLAGLEDESPQVRSAALQSLGPVGKASKAQGSVLVWVLPWIHRRELAALLLGLLFWFALARRVPARRPATRTPRALFFLVVGGLPALTLAIRGVAISTEPWAEGFLPDTFLSLLSFPLTLVLSTSFVCGLATLWAYFVKLPPETGDPMGSSGASEEDSAQDPPRLEPPQGPTT